MRCRGLSLLTLWLAACFFSPLAVAVALGDEPAAGEVRFRWAFGALKAAGEPNAVAIITRDTELASGDRIKIYLEPTTPCFIYLFYLSSQGELERLFPDSDARPIEGGPGVYIPPGDLWFRLDDHPGKETFYLLSSTRRLTALEDVYERCRVAEDPVSRHDLQAQVIDEIRRLRKARHTLTAAAERPIPVGGSLRGVIQEGATVREDLAAMAVEISAADFFSRTFTIDHR